jgi:TPP-dependent pyruvate/acetoin dehydrogenase alpha subunit
MAKKTLKKSEDTPTQFQEYTSISLSDAQRKDIIKNMLYAREFDLAMQRLNRQGKAFGVCGITSAF